MNRRDFGRAFGGAALASPFLQAARPARIAARGPSSPVGYVKAVFTYPPTSRLREESYYSWPGSTFDAEGRQKEYSAALQRAAGELNLRLEIEPRPIDTKEDAERFIGAVKGARPDGLLLIPFKKSHADNLFPIVDQTGLPSVVFTTLGVLLNVHIRDFNSRSRVHVVNSLENIGAVTQGLKLIQARRRMAESTIVNIAGESRAESRVPHLGTRVQRVPLEDFYTLYAQTGRTEEVNARAARYLREAVRVVEPDEKDVYESAKCYSVLKTIVEREKADAMMMTCLPGLRTPRKHVPPCMGFMDLRDEGIPAGCESDLDATLTMMLLQYLFDKPAFQHNPSADTDRKVYFGAHCTSATRMQGPDGPREPFALRSHAEAGWGCVPQVLFPKDRKVTFGKYHSQAQPVEMVIYSGTVTGCPANPPAGGCRSNVEIALDELADPAQVKSHHLCLCYGEHAAQLRAFCRMHGIAATA
ncbi:MAG: hypothetical protein IT158_23545 [Bryobacterales bacterium]|nr:hypothetical protein [Bryobacterales bacterium]